MDTVGISVKWTEDSSTEYILPLQTSIIVVHKKKSLIEDQFNWHMSGLTIILTEIVP